MSSVHRQALTAIGKKLDDYIDATNVLASGSVEHRHDTTYSSFAKEVIKHAPWAIYLREFDVHQIASDHVFRALRKFEVTRKQKLSTILGSETTKQLKEQIVAYLRSIPRGYCVCFELPRAQVPGLSCMSLTKDIDLFVVAKDDPLPGVRNSPSMTITSLFAPSPGLTVGKTYLRFRVPGYANWSLDSSAVALAYSRFRQLLQLAVSMGLLRRDYLPRTHDRSSLSSEVFVYGDPDDPEERLSVALPFSVSDFVATLTLDESKLTVPSGFLSPDRQPATPDEKIAAIMRLLQDALVLFDADDSDEAGNSIRAALEWGFEAETNQNQTFSFVQACIGIEALLGEELDAEAGLTRQLADRCAFLLGKTREDRGFIRKLFTDLYRTRSKLVHGKAVRLSDADRRQLIRATGLLENLARVELSSFVRGVNLRKTKTKTVQS